MSEQVSDERLLEIMDNDIRADRDESGSMARELLELRAERQWAFPSIHLETTYAWCEELEEDNPPQLIEMRMVGGELRCMRWTIAGWMQVTGRICPIKRPQP